MTAIVALVHEGRVLVGADSAAGDGGAQYVRMMRQDRKVFVTGSYVLGFTTSFRMGQLLRWAFDPPKPLDRDGDELERFMATQWLDACRKALKEGGFARQEDGQEIGGNFLVGVKGRLFEVHSDYQIAEYLCGYTATGCGERYALGSLHTTAELGLDPEVRVRAALTAAATFSSGVSTPFHLEWEPAEP